MMKLHDGYMINDSPQASQAIPSDMVVLCMMEDTHINSNQ